MGVRNVLVDGVQDFLLHLADSVAVEDLYLDLWAFLILWMDTVHHLLQEHTPVGRISLQNTPVKGSMAFCLTSPAHTVNSWQGLVGFHVNDDDGTMDSCSMELK